MDYCTELYMFWKDAINRTFLIDHRYQIFLDGIKNTLVITLGALLVGVLIGVAVAISKVYYYGMNETRNSSRSSISRSPNSTTKKKTRMMKKTTIDNGHSGTK